MKIKTIFLMIGLITFQSSLICSTQDADAPLLHQRNESRVKKLICSRYGCIAGVLLTTAAVTAVTLSINKNSSDDAPPFTPFCNTTAIPQAWCNATAPRSPCRDTALAGDGWTVLADFRVRAINCHGCDISTRIFSQKSVTGLNSEYFKEQVETHCGTNATVCFEKAFCSNKECCVNNECCDFIWTKNNAWENIFNPCNATFSCKQIKGGSVPRKKKKRKLIPNAKKEHRAFLNQKLLERLRSKNLTRSQSATNQTYQKQSNKQMFNSGR